MPTCRQAGGFRTYQTLEIALYHSLGALSEPHFNHNFIEEPRNSNLRGVHVL
jgi:hypothetical protein